MDTIALDPRLRHATGFLGRDARMLIDGKMVTAVSGKSFPAWAVAKGNTELLTFLNGFIAKQKETGRFAELQKKWFGEAFPSLPVKWDPEF